MPNLYPALERQEVVIHGPAHVHSFGALDDSTIDLVAEAWQRRARAEGGHCFPILNEGHEAGASLPHSHSQLAWLPAPAPAVAAERGLPSVLEVLARDGVTAGCPVASRVPYELLIAPSQPEAQRARERPAGARTAPARRARAAAAARSRRRARAAERVASRRPALASRGVPADHDGSPGSSSEPVCTSTPSRPRTRRQRCAL